RDSAVVDKPAARATMVESGARASPMSSVRPTDSPAQAVSPAQETEARAKVLRELDPYSPSSASQFEQSLQDDPDPDNRILAIAGLRALGLTSEQTIQAHEALSKAATDSNIDVATAARDALADLDQADNRITAH